MPDAVCHAMVEPWRKLTDELTKELGSRGLDLVHSFRLSWFDDSFSEALQTLWRDHRGGLGLLVGNTRALWPRFLAHLSAAGLGPETPDPLDRWVEQLLGDALAGCGVPSQVVFAHEPPPRRLPFQRLAVHAGFSPLSPGQILAHPVYGPWFALRAVVLFPTPGPTAPALEPREPCAGCTAPCVAAFDSASRAVASRPTSHAVHGHWESWLGVRDSCPVGRGYRYSTEQIRFHYAGQWPASRIR